MNLRPSAARFTDVYDALERLRVLVERGEHPGHPDVQIARDLAAITHRNRAPNMTSFGAARYARVREGKYRAR
jgi:hypothetical protein